MIQFNALIKEDKYSGIVLLTIEQKHPLLNKELEKGEIFPIVHNLKIILYVGLGKREDLSLTELRIFVQKAYQSHYLKHEKSLYLIPHAKEEASIIAITEGISIGGYTWDKYKSKNKTDKTIKDKDVTIAVEPKQSFKDALLIANGVRLTRDLVNDNADVTTSVYLEKVVHDLVKNDKRVSLEILDKKELISKGLNLHVAVNQGSQQEPKLIIVRYQGGKKDDPYTAIVGKGMTFDTGGLNLKPTGSIETMKIDMAGAAAVCGILSNVLSLKIARNLLFVLGIAENAIGPSAYKPGDVIVGYAGKSVEIGNTDAEGRLVLADAFAYLVKNYKPSTIIDLATLTGACVVALGFDYTGLFSDSDELASRLIQSSKTTDDRAWRLPVYSELKDYIKSPIADLKNTSSIKGGGASTAAEFLHQFTEGTPWAHLDIAGTSYVEGAGRMYYGFGATGAGVRLVTHYLINN